MLIDNLESILEWHTNRNRKTAAALRPGLNLFEIKSKLELCFPVIPINYIVLYEWRDGTGNFPDLTICDCSFCAFYFLFSVEDALQHYKMLLEGEVGWKKYWFPVMGNNAGDYYALDFSEDTHEFGSVFRVQSDEPDGEIVFRSIELMMQTFDECFKNGSFFIEDIRKKNVGVDVDKYVNTAAIINPDVSFWKNAANRRKG